MAAIFASVIFASVAVWTFFSCSDSEPQVYSDLPSLSSEAVDGSEQEAVSEAASASFGGLRSRIPSKNSWKERLVLEGAGVLEAFSLTPLGTWVVRARLGSESDIAREAVGETVSGSRQMVDWPKKRIDGAPDI